MDNLKPFVYISQSHCTRATRHLSEMMTAKAFLFFTQLFFCVCCMDTEIKIDVSSSSFIDSKSLVRELMITLKIALKIGFVLLLEMGLSSIGSMYMGHLPNNYVGLRG